MEQLRITTDKNKTRLVPGYRHRNIRGLYITMNRFGCFDVTHEKTGFLVAGHFERSTNALAYMLGIYHAIQIEGIDINSENFRQDIKQSKTKHKHLNNMTILENLTLKKEMLKITGDISIDEQLDPSLEINVLEHKIANLNKKLEG